MGIRVPFNTHFNNYLANLFFDRDLKTKLLFAKWKSMREEDWKPPNKIEPGDTLGDCLEKIYKVKEKKMDLDVYQEKAKETTDFPDIVVQEKGVGDDNYANYIYPALGLAGEAGEVLEQIKKIVRNNHGVITRDRELKVFGELGDVLWYVAILADEFGFNLSAIAENNIKKLAERKKNAKIKNR